MITIRNISRRKINDKNSAQENDILKKKIISKLSVSLIYKNRKKKSTTTILLKKLLIWLKPQKGFRISPFSPLINRQFRNKLLIKLKKIWNF